VKARNSSCSRRAASTARTRLFISAIAFAICCVPAGTLRAQAPPGPQPGRVPTDGPVAPPPKAKPMVKPRQAILGAWILNKEDSDEPRDREEDSRGNRGGYGGRGGAGRGGYGGRGESEEDRARMRELMTPAREIQFAATGAEVDLMDNLDRKRAFMTDGRKLQKSKDSSYAEIAAHWDGLRLVTDEKDPRGNKMSRTYDLSQDGLQLYETLHMVRGRSGTPVVIRFVYDATDNAGVDRAPPSRRPN
jgi:hypothetical protein